MKTLVLGATGQLGANLVRALLAKGDQVRALVRSTSKTFTLDGLDIERVTGDLNDPDSLVRACDNVQVVYQTASYYPPATIPVEVAKAQALRETNNLLNAVRQAGVKRLVFTSTLTTIGFPKVPGQLANEDCPFTTSFPRNPYLIAKAAMEDRVLEAGQAGVPAVVVNPTAFFGPHDSNRHDQRHQDEQAFEKILGEFIHAPFLGIGQIFDHIPQNLHQFPETLDIDFHWEPTSLSELWM